MRLPDAIETVLLILAVFFPFYWYNQSYLSKFSLQLVALLILIFVFHNWLTGKRRGSDPISQYQTITIIMIITVIFFSFFYSINTAIPLPTQWLKYWFWLPGWR